MIQLYPDEAAPFSFFIVRESRRVLNPLFVRRPPPPLFRDSLPPFLGGLRDPPFPSRATELARARWPMSFFLYGCSEESSRLFNF